MLGHNGNLTNATWLRDELTEQGVEFVTASDTEVLAKLIAHAPGRTWAQRVEHAFHRAVGAYHLHHAHRPHALVAARDPLGFRPLALGRLHAPKRAGRPAGRWPRRAPRWTPWAPVRARRRAGRDRDHRRRGRALPPAVAPAPSQERLCVFEFVYLARPDSVIGGRLLYEARLRDGPAPGDASSRPRPTW